jgi:hypothetical protein
LKYCKTERIYHIEWWLIWNDLEVWDHCSHVTYC